ncbi:MAG: xanthine dehydrogenase family protein molybdopterin-binding subunit [Anaerolineae bacterium]
MEAIPQFIGVKVKRREDPELITGRAKYVADIQLDGMLHMAMIRSPFAHARIHSIDAGPALNTDGVVAAYTAEDINPHMAQPLPMVANPDNYEVFRWPKRYPLAEGKVRHVGDPVAVVVAENPYTAADAAELVYVDYEMLPAITDPEAALLDNAPVLHEEWDDNLAYRAVAEGGDPSTGSGQAPDRAFADADVTIQVRLVNQRLIPNAIEPRAVIAQYDEAADSVTIWTTTQIPHAVQAAVVRALGMSWGRVRVVGPDVGGGFGAKANVYQEEFLAPFIAMRLGQPVKWVAGRGEDYLATNHGRDHIHIVELAADAAGRVQGLRLKGIADVGAYYMRATPIPGTHTVEMASGPYQIPNVRAEMTGVFTNKLSTEPYRGAGRPEAAYLVERAMDVLADEIGMDPAELRRRNYIQPDRFPFTTATHLTYDSGEYAGALDKVLEIVDYAGLRAEQARRRETGGQLLGIGVASYVEICGFGPWETGSVTVEPDASVTVRSGTMPNGQGHVTAWSQIAADILQVPLEQVTVKCGDTAEVSRGVGTFGSRSAAVGGSAVATNAETVRQKAIEIAAHLLEAAPGDMTLGAGMFHVRGVPERAVTWQQVAQAAHAGHVPEGMETGLAGEEHFYTQGETYPFGTHICVVEIDPETGETKILRYVSVDDCGRVINPMIVEGQIHGGAAQGIGQALFEGAIYDEAGNLITGSLMDYAVPRPYHLPAFESHRTETPTPLNPLGMKGIGEAATIGSTPAVVNAVVDALSHLGIRHLDMPLTSQQVWQALQRET